MNRALVGILLAALGLGLFAVIASGCGGGGEPAAQTTVSEAGQTVYTVTRAELQNPGNKTLYVCPMVEHQDQVSLDPEARCSLCGMAVIPLEEAEKNWAEEGD